MNTLPIVIVGVAAVVVGAVFCAIQLARLVRLDAASRGLKHPRLWGWFALSGNGQSGLLLYLVGRRKYPVLRLSDETRQQMAHYKKGFGSCQELCAKYLRSGRNSSQGGAGNRPPLFTPQAVRVQSVKGGVSRLLCP